MFEALLVLVYTGEPKISCFFRGVLGELGQTKCLILACLVGDLQPHLRYTFSTQFQDGEGYLALFFPHVQQKGACLEADFFNVKQCTLGLLQSHEKPNTFLSHNVFSCYVRSPGPHCQLSD